MKPTTAIGQPPQNSTELRQFAVARLRSDCGVLSLVSLALLVGCGQGDRIEVARVRGAVTLDGKPYLKGGSVFFQPKATGKMATGEIQADGTYELSTYAPGDGAAVGVNLVMIVPKVAPVDELSEGAGAPPAQLSFPRKYEAVATSGLSCEVKAGQQNEFPIDMRTK
jgi:hypothetical protein